MIYHALNVFKWQENTSRSRSAESHTLSHTLSQYSLDPPCKVEKYFRALRLGSYTKSACLQALAGMYVASTARLNCLQMCHHKDVSDYAEFQAISYQRNPLELLRILRTSPWHRNDTRFKTM